MKTQGEMEAAICAGIGLLSMTTNATDRNGESHLQTLVQEITGVRVVSLHHDISTVTGEAFIIFTLAEPPLCRQSKK